MNEDNWLEGIRPEAEKATKKGWDEDFDRPVPLCAVEEMIWEEQAAKEATLAEDRADEENGS